MTDLRVDVDQRYGVRRGDFLRQNAILSVFDPRDRHHRNAARQFIETGPWPFGIKRAQHGFVSCHQRERLDENRRPAGRLRGKRAGLQQWTDIEGPPQRNKGYFDRRMHEVGNETARY